MNVEISNLTKTYSGKTVLNIKELTFTPNQIIGIVGNNGAGKTTFLRLILDLIKADSGEVLIDRICTSKSEKWKNITGSFLDSNFLIDFLTPDEYLHFIGKLYGFSKTEIDNKLTQYSDFMNNEIVGKGKYIRDLSSGNKQKVGIIGSLITEAKLIIQDEPFNSLDPSSQIQLKNILKNFNINNKATILISSHNLQYVIDICDRILLFEKGEILQDLKSKEQYKNLENYFS